MTSNPHAAYLATTYRIYDPAGAHIDLRVGETSRALDALLSRHSARHWAFITAWNPASQPLSPEENDSRQLELVRIVRDRGWPHYQGAGIPHNPDWKPEQSLLVVGIARAEAIGLGMQFGQNAIVAGLLSGPAELVYCV